MESDALTAEYSVDAYERAIRRTLACSPIQELHDTPTLIRIE
jgi:hypothetical protein